MDKYQVCITCIGCKHVHQIAPFELVTNLATTCHHLYWFQIWPLDDYLQIWPPDGTTYITNKFAHQTKSHALPDCFGLLYWHYQLVLTWYLHQPESHQLSFKSISSVTTGPIDRTPGTPGSDKNWILIFKMNSVVRSSLFNCHSSLSSAFRQRIDNWDFEF